MFAECHYLVPNAGRDLLTVFMLYVILPNVSIVVMLNAVASRRLFNSVDAQICTNFLSLASVRNYKLIMMLKFSYDHLIIFLPRSYNHLMIISA
jgi:hypothetical protein